MKKPEIDFDVALVDLLDEQSREAEPLTPDELAAWRNGHLPEADRAKLQARLLLDKEGVRSLLSETEPPTEKGDELASWRALEARLDATSEDFDELDDKVQLFSKESRRNRRSLFPHHFVNAAAAVLLLSTLWLAWRVHALRQTGLMVPISDVVNIGDNERAGQSTIEVVGEYLALVLAIHERMGEYPLWQLTLRDYSGRIVYSGQSPSHERKITLMLLRDKLPGSGSYSIELAGIKNKVIADPVVLNVDIELK